MVLKVVAPPRSARRGGAGGDKVGDDEDALARRDAVLVHLEVLDGVLVGGLDAGRLARQLAFLADDGQAEAELPGQGRGGEEAPGFDPGADLRCPRHGPGGELVAGEAE